MTFSLLPFWKILNKFFELPPHQETSSKKKLVLRQGQKSVADFSVYFRIATREAGWDDLALRGIFSNALNDQIKGQLATREEPDNLNKLINLAIHIDNHMRERQNQANYSSQNSSLPVPSFPAPVSNFSTPPLTNFSPEPEPMQIGRTCLTPEERQCRKTAKECLYCGKKGHLIANCTLCLKGRTHQ